MSEHNEAMLAEVAAQKAATGSRVRHRKKRFMHGFIDGIPLQEYHVDAVACLGGGNGAPLPLSFFRNEFLATNTGEDGWGFVKRNPWVQAVRRPQIKCQPQIKWQARSIKHELTTCSLQQKDQKSRH